MKSLVFDSSTIISLALNNLLWILKPLKEKYNGEFYITEEVKQEIIDNPMQTKRFKLEAIQIQELLEEGIFKIHKDPLNEKEQLIEQISNEIFFVKDHYMKIIHGGEISSLALAAAIDAEAFVVDERTTRLLIENPELLSNIFKHKLHTKIKVNNENLKLFAKDFSKIKVIRSTELVTMAYEIGLLDTYLSSKITNKKEILEAVIWGMRFKGCSISDDEITELLKIE